MKSQTNFDRKLFVQKVVARFGTCSEPFTILFRHTEDVLKYIRKIEDAHQKAAESTLNLDSIYSRAELIDVTL